jgi:hypothetical protein
MPDWFPDEPDVPASQIAAGDSPLRYEDVSQDGRLMLLALPHAIGSVVWQHLLRHTPVTAATRSGLVPILTRFVIEGGDGPISVRWPLSASGRYQLAHTVEHGEVDRVLFNIWVSATAPLGRMHGPPPDRAGEAAFAGRVFAEHVFTRLFAPPDQRKVRRLDIDGLEPVPEARWTWRAPEAVLTLPAGARPLDATLEPDDTAIVFGLTHTDSNQHVNSLVYPRLFQDAVLRRLHAHGRPVAVLARRLEVAYRKPCFAGDRVRFLLQTYLDGERVGAVGILVPDGQPDAKPYCTIQMTLTP